MKKLFTLMLATLAVCCVACLPNEGGSGKDSAEFDISVSAITAESATVSVTPSNDIETYYFDILEKSVFDTYSNKIEIAELIVSDLQNMCNENDVSLVDILSKGADSYDYAELTPATEYVAYAFGVNANGTITTEVFTKTFKTSTAATTPEVPETPGTGTNYTNFVYGYYEDFGDFYSVGAKNWYIDLYTEDTYDVFVIEVQTALTATEFVGTYPITGTFASGTAVAGGTDSEGYIYGSFWGLMDTSEEILTDVKFLNSGSVTISQSGSDYVIKVDALDDSGDKITLDYTGVLEFFDSNSSDGIVSSSVKTATPSRRFHNVAKIKGVRNAKSVKKQALIKRNLR